MAWVVATSAGLGPAGMGAKARRLAEALAAAGWPTLLAPDLYRLDPAGAAAARLKSLEGPLVLLSWLHPRAAFWLLDRAGVRGVPAQSVNGDPGHIVCLTLDADADPKTWSARLEQIAPGVRRETGASLEEVNGDEGERWYPVVDFRRCTQCLDCIEFCLFGVYDVDAEGRLAVARPDLCKPGCPACSRVCPEQAIMFPLYRTDPAVAGADGAEVRAFTAEEVGRIKEGLAGGRLTLAEAIRACACRNGSGPGAACRDCPCARGEPCDCDAHGIEAMIDRLARV